MTAHSFCYHCFHQNFKGSASVDDDDDDEIDDDDERICFNVA